MSLQIWGASTLKNFTDSVRVGFLENEADIDFTLIQIHGAPAAREEDQKLIELARGLKTPKVFLIHRPDEALLNPLIKNYFESEPKAKLIFLGDLIFRIPFWADRRALSAVIPHPHLDFSMPTARAKAIVGSFTSWGEMRDVRHYFSLVESLGAMAGIAAATEAFEFRIGGRGLDRIKIPNGIHFSKEPFVPHFNVQLYHLNGKKRYGESSGSLHRGISIPVIFEANGAERLEGFKAVKIQADDDLKSIEFEKAVKEIFKITIEGSDPILEINRKAAQLNSVSAFAKAVQDFLQT